MTVASRLRYDAEMSLVAMMASMRLISHRVIQLWCRCAAEVNTDFLEARAVRPGGGVGAGDDSRRQSILQPSDIAAAVRFLVELPPRAHVPELVIKPTIDDFS